ncbi:MAG TPA: polymer-forming cytoskeletal protein [Methylomirabilota bacterium]|nr:polymer-forming cytoskeletal protein [Methylomirabilota bacterium]
MGVMRTALGYFGLNGGESSRLLGLTERTAAPARRARAVPEAPGIGARLVLRGEVSGEGDFHVLGKFEGEINVTGKVYVAEGAQVDANINAAAIQIGGVVRGNLSASTRVEILPSGVLTGTLKTGSFSAADGASVKGEIWVDRAGPARAVELRSGT